MMTVITVGGPPGSGTTTICRLLKKKTGFDYIYAGEIFRKIAEENEYSLAEFGTLCEEDPSWDKRLDDEMILKAREDDIILEGRMIGPLCKREGILSFNIYIDANFDERTRRVLERESGQIENRKREMKRREKSETKRYQKFYGIDPGDPSWYDLIIDSTSMTPEEEVDLILEKLRDLGKG